MPDGKSIEARCPRERSLSTGPSRRVRERPGEGVSRARCASQIHPQQRAQRDSESVTWAMGRVLSSSRAHRQCSSCYALCSARCYHHRHWRRCACGPPVVSSSLSRTSPYLFNSSSLPSPGVTTPKRPAPHKAHRGGWIDRCMDTPLAFRRRVCVVTPFITPRGSVETASTRAAERVKPIERDQDRTDHDSDSGFGSLALHISQRVDGFHSRTGSPGEVGWTE